MCGIFGAIRNINSSGAYELSNDTLKNFTYAAMKASQIRGSDSTGLIKVNKAYKKEYQYNAATKDLPKEDCRRIWVYKLPLPAEKFAEDPKVKHMLTSVNSFTSAVIGHTRNASSANPANNNNNHPHVAGNIIGVHNGNIANWRQLAKRFDLKLKGNCDSEVIFALIEKFMYEKGNTFMDAIKETCYYLEGNYACAVIDKSKGGVFGFFRNNAPLCLRYRSTSSTLLFASTREILALAYCQAKVDGTMQTEMYMESGELIFPDRHGYILTHTKNNISDDWIKKAKPFALE